MITLAVIKRADTLVSWWCMSVATCGNNCSKKRYNSEPICEDFCCLGGLIRHIRAGSEGAWDFISPQAVILRRHTDRAVAGDLLRQDDAVQGDDIADL
jgi:hypothetical protein